MTSLPPTPTSTPSIGESLRDWYERHFESGWTKAWSARFAAAGLTVPFGPELINVVIERWTVINALPGFDLRTKLWMLCVALALVLLARPFRQGNMPGKVEPVARFYVPRTVRLETARGAQVPVAAQVVPVDDESWVPSPAEGRVL